MNLDHKHIRVFFAQRVAPQEVDDLVQESLRRAIGFRGERTVTGTPADRKWLLTIARRVWVDHLRSKYRHPASRSIHDTALGTRGLASRIGDPRQTTPSEGMRQGEMMSVVRKAMDDLETTLRVVVQGRMDGKSAKELGDMLDRSEADVFYYMKKIRRRMNAIIRNMPWTR